MKKTYTRIKNDVDSTIQTLSREALVSIFALGTLEELERKKFLSGLKVKLSATALPIFNRLVEQDFSPTDEELHAAVDAILSLDNSDVVIPCQWN